jgi:hypothetical protein
MFRWLDQLLSRLRRDNSEHHAFERGWVEPSNAITRAILSGAVTQLAINTLTSPPAGRAEPAVARVATPEHSPVIAETPEPAQDKPGLVSRTARRARRRRAGRAA